MNVRLILWLILAVILAIVVWSHSWSDKVHKYVQIALDSFLAAIVVMVIMVEAVFWIRELT